MASNADRERWWIDAWNDLFDIVGRRTDAYAGWQVGVRAGSKDEGVQVVASRWRKLPE